MKVSKIIYLTCAFGILLGVNVYAADFDEPDRLTNDRLDILSDEKPSSPDAPSRKATNAQSVNDPSWKFVDIYNQALDDGKSKEAAWALSEQAMKDYCGDNSSCMDSLKGPVKQRIDNPY